MMSKFFQTENHNLLMASIGYKTSNAGAGVGVIAWLTSQEGLAIVGVMIALAGWLTNMYYKRKEDERAHAEREENSHFKKREDARAQIEHELRVKELREALGVDDVK